MRRALLTLATMVAGALLPATIAASAPARAADDADRGNIGIRLLEAPTSLGDDPRAKKYIIDFLPLGTVIHRRLEVTNQTPTARRFTIYAGAAQIKDGRFEVAPGAARNDLTTWIDVDKPTIDLPPWGSTVVTTTLAVPADAAPGERYAVVWAQAAGAPGPGNITMVSRVGIRTYIYVGEGAAPASDFDIVALTARRLPDGRPAVAARVHNTGGRAIDMSGTLSLTSGPGGLSAGPFPAQLGTTLGPGEAEPVQVVLDKALPEGPWKVRITLRSGLLKRTAEATLRFPRDTGDGKTVDLHAGRSIFRQPAVLAGGLGGLVALGLVAALTVRSRRRSRSAGD